MNPGRLHTYLFDTLRGRLILGVALIHAVMMTVFVVDLTMRQRDMLLVSQEEHARGMAQTLSVSAAGWLAANDIAGLQELVDAQRSHPDLTFVILAEKDGQVLAHTDTSKRGQRLLDLPGDAKQSVKSKSAELVDVVTPVMLAGRHVGWARVGVNQKSAGKKLSAITLDGAYYAVTAILLGTLVAWLLGRQVTRRLYVVQETINRVKGGDHAARSTVAGRDEAALLAQEFNTMLDSLSERDAELEKYRDHLESLVEERTVELQLARVAAETANQAKSIFLSNMSHEIRTPMHAVLGFAQLLERDPTLSPQARNRVSTIMKSGDHLLAIINDILEMSRIEAGRVEMRVESVDLYALLDDLSVMFRMRAEEKGLAFTLDSAADFPRYIVTDLGKLRQVMTNLLGNAVKFTKAGAITLRALPAGSDRIAIEVQDSGIGISTEELGKLFRPFERTRSGEQTAGGTGLGLAVSREYAHQMGGEITVTSIAGEGSCFRFEFSAPVSEKMPLSAVAPRRATGLVSGQGDIRVLVVDDQGGNRDMLREMLEPFGFVVGEAADGREALEKATSWKPHIILMDQVMPGMDGREATRILRERYAKESVAIIGITASAFEESKQQFLDSGIDAYIAKPFREQELYDVLARHAGVRFESEEIAPLARESQSTLSIPTLDKMSPAWREEFLEVLSMKNITRIRKLGEAAQEVDPVLAAWILERTGRYELNSLKKLV